MLLAAGLALTVAGCGKKPVVSQKDADESMKRVTEAHNKRLQEAAAWETTSSTDTIEGYRAFISKYPEGEHTALAKSHLDRQTQLLAAGSIPAAQDLAENPGGTLRVFCEAGYVARFFATWDERQPNGSYVSRSWESGNLSAGRRSQVQIPERARNVRLRAEGVAVGEIFNISRPQLKFGKEYKVYGTIFSRGWSEQ